MTRGKGIVFVQPHAFHKMEWRIEILEEFERAHIIHDNRLEDAYRQRTNTRAQTQNKTVAELEKQ